MDELIIKKLSQQNFQQVSKLIEDNPIGLNLINGVLKNQIKRFRSSYATPAQTSKAKEHQQAVKYGYRKPLKGRAPSGLCECCNLRIDSEQLPICETIDIDAKKMNTFQYQYRVRSDVALFFAFIKSVIIYILFHCIIHSGFTIYANHMLGKHCQISGNCVSTIWNTLSTANNLDRQDLINIIDILNLATIVISIIFFYFARKSKYQMNRLIDKQVQGEQDYTLLVSNIPLLDFPTKQQSKKQNSKQFFYRNHLKNYFQKKVTDWLKQRQQWDLTSGTAEQSLNTLIVANQGQLRSDDIVKSLSLCYNLSRLQIIQQVRAKLINQYQNSTNKSTQLVQQDQQMLKSRFSSIPKTVDFLSDCQIVLNQHFAKDNSLLFNLTNFSGHALVSFQYQQFKQFLMVKNIQNPKSLLYKGNYLKIEDASDPTDIYWINLKYSDIDRRERTLIAYSILFMILIFAFVILLFLERSKQSVSGSTGQSNLYIQYGLTFLISIMILVINYLIDYIVRKLTQYQKNKTRTNQLFSLLVKLFVTQFINTAILYFLISILWKNQVQGEFTQSLGLIFQISTLITVSGFIQIIVNLIYPSELYRKIMFKFRKHDQEGQERTVDSKFQITLNKQFQYTQFDMATRYAYYLLQLYTACFYSYMVPITMPVLLIIFFIQYWIDKFNLFKRSSLKFVFNFSLSRYVSRIYESSLLIFAVGNFVFSLYLHNLQITLINLTGLGIAFVFVLLIWVAPNKIQKKLFGSYQSYQTSLYDECLGQGKFQTTYWTQNPATFLVQEEKITGIKKPVNPNVRKSREEKYLI